MATAPVSAPFASAASSVCHAKFEPLKDTITGKVDLQVVTFAELFSGNPAAIAKLKAAAHAHGIVGVTDIPDYEHLVDLFLRDFRKFCALPEEVKGQQKMVPNRAADEFTGYELGAERFPLPNGEFVNDKAKHSLYELVPDVPNVNKWPDSCGLGAVRDSYEAIGKLMINVGMKVMEAIGLIGGDSPVKLADNHVGRGLHYTKGDPRNPLACGAHKDHGFFTALLPAIFEHHGRPIVEPEEAGLYVQTTGSTGFQKVDSSNRKILYFQIGETAQLITNDRVIATPHRVHAIDPDSPLSDADRYTLALFFALPMNFPIRSSSVLTQNNPRWKGTPVSGQPGVTEWTFGDFHTTTLNFFKQPPTAS
jgi:isopenicillin N synthase-like dioxygenase